jgi:lipoate-protein ligase A
MRGGGRPAENMAVDVAVAWGVGEGIAPPTLRLYRWDSPAVSLGYAQRDEGVDLAACARAGLTVVRRPTGGRAVLHGGDLTYAVALPRRGTWATWSVAMSCRAIHAAVARGLQSLGVPALVAGERPSAAPGRGGPVCFAGLGTHEIAVGGRKLVGSAQRRFARAILQHGSVLLTAQQDRLVSFCVPGRGSRSGARGMRVTSLGELLHPPPEPAALAAALVAGFAETFGVRLEEAPLAPRELALARRLESRFGVGPDLPALDLRLP